VVFLIAKSLAESNGGTTRCAQTSARQIFGFNKSLDHAAGEEKGTVDEMKKVTDLCL
jgi:hypothetical protein